MSWEQLRSIVKSSRQEAAASRELEKYVCPNDGEPLTQGRHGRWRCRYDGYEPSDQPSG